MPLALLLRAKLDQVPFSLVLVGDNGLLTSLSSEFMPRCAAGWDTACNWDLSMLNKVANTFEYALRSANIHANPFQPDALELLIQAGGGLLRTINHLGQRAMEALAIPAHDPARPDS
jgi:hypothetical protein